MTLDTRWLRRALVAGLGLLVSWACAGDDYNFVPDKKPASCTNGQEDEGETDVDCGGGKCDQCQTGDKCTIPADCVSGSCPADRCAAPACDDGIINGTEKGRDCGGGLCDGCPTGTPCTEPIDCASGVCEGPEGEKKCATSCIQDTAECDGDTELECETNLLTDPMHCGDCAIVCELPHAEQSCVSGRCMIASCIAPYDNCNSIVDDGCEANLETAASDCGMCGNECSDVNGTPSCEESGCQIECDEGFADCDPDRPGCEQSVDDVLSCGDCGRECPSPAGETPFCLDGECGSTPCPDGFGNCDGLGDTCEEDLTDDVTNCGRCRGLCTVSNGTPNCVDSACGIQSCEAGWDNCDTDEAGGGYANGCETNTDEDPMNCGACGRVCPSANGTPSCVDGECRIACNAGWDDCSGGVTDGCETNTTSDKGNCGACDRDCDALFAAAPVSATGTCVNSTCEVDACLPNFDDCDSNPDTCESDLRTDAGDCGACGVACVPTGVTSAGNVCTAGSCRPNCDATHANCDQMGPNGCEINTNTNATHCGGCNMGCTGGRPCISGMCGCSGGQTLCDDACVNTASDGMNCGGCGTVCTGGRMCTNSVCQCPPGQTFCGGVCVNTQTDRMNCNSCGTVCQLTGATTNNCMGGACQPMCNTPTTRGNCDSDPTNGCETTFASNNAHCGACGRACQFGASAHVTPATQAGNSCSTGGVCVPICATDWGNCDGVPQNGCEADLTSGTTCGASCTACASATPACVASGSTRACQATIALPTNGAVADGVVGPTLTLMHNLPVAAGSNRMVVVGVVARATTGGIAQARPDAVTYNGVAMTAGPEFDGGAPVGNDGQGHVFYYFMNNATLPATTGTRPVVIDGAPGTNDPTVVTAMAVLLTGVRQTNPLSASTGGAFPVTCATTQPGNSVPLATTGSVVLSMSGAQYPGAGSLTGSLTMLMDNEPSVDSTMKAMGGIRGVTSVLASPGPYSVGSSYAWCAQSVHFAVVVHPAQQ